MSKRHFVAIALTASVAVIGLTACGGPAGTPTPTDATPSATATPDATPSPSATPAPSRSPAPPVVDSLAGINVTGKFGELPKISFKAPYAVSKTLSKTLIEGTGPEVTADAVVQMHYDGYNGSTGKLFQETFSKSGPSKGNPMTTQLAGLVKGFQTGVTGQKEGSRVLVAMPGAEAYDAMGGSPDAGILVGDTLVFVVDIVQTERKAPETSGTVTPPGAGLPSVTDVANAAPTVTIPGTPAPTTMTAQTLIEGSGPKVTADAILLTHYVGYSWQTGKAIETKYDTADQGELSTAIPGWQKGLVGKTVGSRVLLVLPPADGFPQGSNNPPLSAGDTVVYVVDILFAVSTASLGG